MTGPKMLLCLLATMSDAEHLVPELYREAAEQVRRLAGRARLTDVRNDLLELSARFERLGTYADVAISLGLPEYPHGELLLVAGDRPHHRCAADQRQSRTPGR